jgi:rubrerythrin
MDNFESDKEILEFAIARENEAHNLYMALADRVLDPNIRKLLELLAGEELEHKATLELEITKTGRSVSTELKAPRPSNEYILTDNPAPLDMDYKDVLLLGMAKEDSAFRIYVSLIPRVYDEQSREVLYALAQEEVKHKLRFETEYNILQKNTRNQE